MQLPEDPRAALDERLDLEVFFPDRPIAQVLREPGHEQVGRLEQVPVGRDDEVAGFAKSGMVGDLSAWERTFGRRERSFRRVNHGVRHRDQGGEAVTQAVEATPGGLDLG